MRICPVCYHEDVIEDGYCGGCRQTTLEPIIESISAPPTSKTPLTDVEILSNDGGVAVVSPKSMWELELRLRELEEIARELNEVTKIYLSAQTLKWDRAVAISDRYATWKEAKK
jgi:hypothetical protein